jgi:two-component system CheB/CheR fusion protein
VVAADGTIVIANGQARRLFGLGPADLDRPFSELELSFQPVELRSLIQQSIDTGQPVTVRDVAWPTETGEARTYDVQLAPLAAHGARIGTAISFSDVTQFRQLRESLERSRNELETAYEELQSTAEELETTNEELQSTNEELETTNEELQSTNEELETTVEELQAANTELAALNAELEGRTAELNRLDAFHRSLLNSLEQAIAVLDRDGVVTAWNQVAERLWGLPAEHAVARPFFALPIGEVAERARAAFDEALATAQTTAIQRVLSASPGGAARQGTLRMVPLRSMAGELLGVVAVIAADDVDRVGPPAT